MSGLVWFLLFGALFFFMMRAGCGAHVGHGGHGGHEGHGNPGDQDDPQGPAATRNVDPVCGMAVDPAAGYAENYRGVQYRFCSRDCLDKFDASPDRYAGGKPDAAAHGGHPT